MKGHSSATHSDLQKQQLQQEILLPTIKNKMKFSSVVYENVGSIISAPQVSANAILKVCLPSTCNLV